MINIKYEKILEIVFFIIPNLNFLREFLFLSVWKRSSDDHSDDLSNTVYNML